MNLSAILAVAAIGASLGGPSINSAHFSEYRERQDKLAAERAKALTKKQRIREEIRARREAMKAGVTL